MGGIAKKVLWLLFVGSVAIAVIRVFPWQHPNEVWVMLGDYAKSFGSWISGVIAGFHTDQLPTPDPIVLPTVAPTT